MKEFTREGIAVQGNNLNPFVAAPAFWVGELFGCDYYLAHHNQRIASSKTIGLGVQHKKRRRSN